MREVEKYTRYSCPMCMTRDWGEGNVSGDTRHCLCSDGYWVWHNGTWEWREKR